MREICQFDVFGMPAPQGSKKFVGTNKAGRGILVESSKKVRPWRHDVKVSALEVIRHAGTQFPEYASQYPLNGPLLVAMVFTMPKPASAPKRKRTWPDKKPDLSKLARSTEDALVDAGLILDDSRIVEYVRLAKVFPGEDRQALRSPGVSITIYMPDNDA